LDDWAYVRRIAAGAKADWRRLVAAARAADPDPWRDALRSKVGTNEIAALAEFRRLADDARALATQPAVGLILLVAQLKYANGPSGCCDGPGIASRTTSGSI